MPQHSKHDDLSRFFSPHTNPGREAQICHTSTEHACVCVCTFVCMCVCRDRWVPVPLFSGYQPASQLSKMASSRFSDRFCLKWQRNEEWQRKTHNVHLWSLNIHNMWAYLHIVCTYACTKHIPKKKNKTKQNKTTPNNNKKKYHHHNLEESFKTCIHQESIK